MPVPGGFLLHLHVQPGASRTELAGRHGDALKIRVTGAPVDGKANRELVLFLAETLGIPRGQIVVVRGTTARRKTVAIEGMTAERAIPLLGLQAAD